MLEALTTHLPVGVDELARRLDSDKNAVQRPIATLTEAGWVATPNAARPLAAAG